MLLQVIGDAGKDVGPVVPQITMTGAPLVDCVALEARRHELRHAHRAGVGTQRRERVEFAVAAEPHELLELLLEVLGARRIVEGEGRQRVEDAVTARDTAEGGFDADDAEQVFGEYVPLQGDGIEQLAVLAPEPGAGVDAIAGQETGAIFPPGQGFLRRPVHRVDDGRLRLGLGEQRKGRGATESPGGEALHEGGDVGALQIKARVAGQHALDRCRGFRVRRGQRRRRQQRADQQQRQGAQHHELTSLRVTTEVPP